MVSLSIIIVNYNTDVYLDKCLSSIIKLIENVEYEIIIIDNNSPIREIEELSRKYKFAKFIFRNVNDGFGAGCNYGAKIAVGKYLAFVNPDIIFYKNVFNELINVFEEDDKLGVCSPIFIDSQNKISFTFNTFPDIIWEFYEFIGKGYERRIKKLLSNENIIEKSKSPYYVDWVTGACMIVKKEVFNKVEGFDKSFFLYYEDVDLQLKISKLGYRNAILPSCSVFHSVNCSTKSLEGENIYIYNMYKSKLIYYKKNTTFAYSLFIRLFHILGILFRIIFLYFRNRYKDKRKVKIKQYLSILEYYLFGKFKWKKIKQKDQVG
jgi:GT2 family glycosyltransferase